LRTKITKILNEKFGNKNIGTVEQNMAAKRNKASTEDQNESKYGTKLSNMGNKNIETMEQNMNAKQTI
jgi:hypothetical protein